MSVGPLTRSAPAFFVGLTAAVAVELAAGLLLYVSAGLLSALTAVLAVSLGSFSLGLWVGARVPDERPSEVLRRRWLLALVALLVAAVVAAAWSLLGGLAERRMLQGVGLALLAGLPLYACGSLLASLAAARGSSGPRLTALPASFGAAAGALLTGAVFVTLLIPPSTYVFCIFLLSVGALFDGRFWGARPMSRELHRRESAFGPVTVEETTDGGGVKRRLLENGRVLGAEDDEGRPLWNWELATARLVAALVPGADDPGAAPPTVSGSVLVMGGGAFTLPRLLLREAPWLRVVVVERNPELVRTAQDHFRAPLDHPRLNVVEALGGPVPPGERFGVVVQNAVCNGNGDPVPILSDDALRSVRGRLVVDGVFVLSGVSASRRGGRPLRTLNERACGVFGSATLFLPRADQLDHDEGALIATWPAAPTGTDLGGFVRADGTCPRPEPGEAGGEHGEVEVEGVA